MDENELLLAVMKRAKTDPWYQECVAHVNRHAPAFDVIRASLSPAQQEQLDLYIAACEDLEAAKTYIAYDIVRENT